jgi:cellulose 1,4-beta-cellobiosidase
LPHRSSLSPMSRSFSSLVGLHTVLGYCSADFKTEPDSLANLVTNLNVAKCANAANAYKTLTTYAIKTLNLKNVIMYLDAGHAGWLGWTANIGPAAELFGSLYKAAGSPAAVRGLVTNVANYNAWSIATCPSYTQGNTNCDEKRYVNALAPLLVKNGFPAHFLTDTGTSHKFQPLIHHSC